MNRYLIRINGKELQVSLKHRDNSLLIFIVNEKTYEVDVQPLLQKVEAPSATLTFTPRHQPHHPGKTITADNNHVVAPMPGIIVSVLVKEGDQVQRGQTVVVMEAMKMENNITVLKDGVVKKVSVKAGQEVNNSQMLVSIE